jgi:3',5'-cyclic AMP phosphodiesterase CpdA
MVATVEGLRAIMWRFVQVSDPHLASDFDGEWNHKVICTMMPGVMDCLRRDLADIQPDFILATGDIVSQQTREAMLCARDAMDSLGFPYYPMGGNHDFVVEDSRKWFLEAYAHHLPRQATYYSFTHRGLHFIVLDPWWLWSDESVNPVTEQAVLDVIDKDIRGARWALPPQQFDWLEQDLKAHADLPTIVAVHYPPIPAPPRLRYEGFRDAGKLENGPELLELLSRHKQVRAVFTGHVHSNFVEERHGITQVTTGAMPEFPCEYRVIEVHEDRLEVYCQPLSDPGFAERSLIPEHRITAGEPQDRRVTISLRWN